MTWAHAQSGRGTLSRNSCEHTTHSGSYRLVPRASAGQHVQVKVRLAPFVKPAADELAGMQPDGTASNRRAINGLYYRGRCHQSAFKRRGSLELRRPATDQTGCLRAPSNEPVPLVLRGQSTPSCLHHTPGHACAPRALDNLHCSPILRLRSQHAFEHARCTGVPLLLG